MPHSACSKSYNLDGCLRWLHLGDLHEVEPDIWNEGWLKEAELKPQAERISFFQVEIVEM